MTILTRLNRLAERSVFFDHANLAKFLFAPTTFDDTLVAEFEARNLFFYACWTLRQVSSVHYYRITSETLVELRRPSNHAGSTPRRWKTTITSKPRRATTVTNVLYAVVREVRAS
jgi:hypothetical protein